MAIDADVIFFRLLLATLLGGIIGAEREWRNQPAGLRTHLILSLGSALVMIVSVQVANEMGGDPTRIASNIVTGIGFLGAGAILRLGISIRGLTTAANIWTTAAIGMAVGAGIYWAAFVTTAFLMVGLVILRRYESHFSRKKTRKSILVTARDAPDILKKMEEILQKTGTPLVSLEFRRDASPDRIEIRGILETSSEAEGVDLTVALKELEEILEVEVR